MSVLDPRVGTLRAGTVSADVLVFDPLGVADHRRAGDSCQSLKILAFVSPVRRDTGIGQHGRSVLGDTVADY